VQGVAPVDSLNGLSILGDIGCSGELNDN